jgi:hypothetical protein
MVVLVVNPAAGVAHAVLVFVALERARNTIPAVNSRRHVNSLGKFNSVAHRPEWISRVFLFSD